MKLLAFPALAAVCVTAAVNPFDPLVCLDYSPSKISATATKSATQSSNKGWATTSGGLITSYDYNRASPTLWVFPTGSGSHEATKVIFAEAQVVNISFVVVVVEVIGRQTMTVVSSDLAPSSVDSTTASVSATSADSAAASASATSADSAAASASVTSADSTAITQPKTTHLVNVGTGQGYTYDPSQLDASIGDTVRFNFLGRNHSVTQSDLASPCTYSGGFDTGLNQFNPLNTSGKFLVDYQVSVSKPLWFYCKQVGPPSHCGKGMVFAINPGDNFPEFQRNAVIQGQALTILTNILGSIGNVSSISMNAIDHALFNSTIRRRYPR
ncbi:hypothetical protein O988_06067 [Pseudogymnoascus sp. VKM F-3808]|nr:hypothetical protein O988_06067 [Pseudogymnoascus sp. VKM F-3808]